MIVGSKAPRAGWSAALFLVLVLVPASAGWTAGKATKPAVAPTVAPSVEGYWAGTIGVADDKTLEVMIDVARKDAGWRVRFYAPAQGIHGVELTDVEIAGRSARFRIPNSDGDPTFRGELAADGSTLAGNFDDSGKTLPFHLTRAKRPEKIDVDIYEEYRQPGLPGVGLAGNWRGLLMTGPNRMRLALYIKDSGGRLTGWLASLDQGGEPKPVDTFKLDENKVRFEMEDLGALYKGTMKPDGSEFYGVWVQSGTEFPLTFRRTSPPTPASPGSPAPVTPPAK